MPVDGGVSCPFPSEPYWVQADFYLQDNCRKGRQTGFESRYFGGGEYGSSKQLIAYSSL